MGVGAYPGTFDPPTIAHLAVAEAARAQGGLDRVVLVVTRVSLGKGSDVAPLERRVAALEALAADRPWMAVKTTEHQLLVEACRGYDALVLGSDKWLQVSDATWYGSVEARDAAVAALPRLLLAPRLPWEVSDAAGPPLPEDTVVLDLDPVYAAVSSTAVRGGRSEWLAGGPA